MKSVYEEIPLFAIGRKSAFEKLGFKKTEEHLIGIDNLAYRDYWQKIS